MSNFTGLFTYGCRVKGEQHPPSRLSIYLLLTRYFALCTTLKCDQAALVQIECLTDTVTGGRNLPQGA